MLVRSTDDTMFATGAATYNDAPEVALSSQIVLQVEIAGLLTEAFVDTNSQYIVCTPSLSEAMGLNPDDAFFEDSILIKGVSVRGKVHPVEIQFFADEDKGESLSLEAYAFVVDEYPPIFADDLPSSSIGFTGCLESVCFAIDGGRRLFYFG